MHSEEPGIHIFAGFKGLHLEDELERIIREFRPGGIVLFKRNVEGREQVKELVASAQRFALEEMGRPLLVAIDQEGGTVQRLAPHFSDLPSAKSLSEMDASDFSQWVRTAAADLVEIGIHINFAPVLDIAPESGKHFLASRTLGSSPEAVAELGTIWIKTLQENGVSATAKHFPGLGRAELDPHRFAPVIQADSEEEFQRHLIPYKAAVKAGVHCMMTSHAVYPAIDPDLPATLSYAINHEWLRERLGFGGILFSDDLDMAAIEEKFPPGEIVARGLLCGIDFFLLCQKSENIEPFFKTLADSSRQDKWLQAARERSLDRIDGLLRLHSSNGIA